MILLLPALVAVGVLAIVTTRRASRRMTDVAWVDRDARVAGAFVAASPRRTALALARAEAGLWFSSAWFAAGIALSLLEVVLFGWVWAAEDTSSWPQFVVLYPIFAFPLTGMAVIGAHFAVTRSKRDRAEEIFSACPTDEITRTAAHALSGWVPSVALGAFVIVLTVLVPVHDTHLYGLRILLAGDVLAAVVLGWCGAALGVALGRWASFALAPVVFLFGLLVAIVKVGNLGDPHWSNLRQLSPWPRYPNHDLLFTDRHVWSHLAWLIALGALMVVIAFLHARRDRQMLVVAGAVVVAVVAAGSITARPISDAAAARLASLVSDPASHQTCRTTGHVSVCAYHGYEEYLDQVLLQVRPVAAAVAAVNGNASPVVLRQQFDGRVAVLGPEVATAMHGRPIARADDALGYETGQLSMIRARLVVAARAVGLPVAPVRGRPYVAAGQARGVVALWLAAQGLPAGDQPKVATYHFDPFVGPDRAEPTAFDLGNAWPPTCDGAAPAVVWSEPDLVAARRLMARPASVVSADLASQWSRFADASTSTNELLAALGLGSVAAPAPFATKPFAC